MSSEINVFVGAQLTPWFHAEASVGLDGVGLVVGFDVGDTSYDFEINGGWGLALAFVFNPVAAGAAGVIGYVPAY